MNSHLIVMFLMTAYLTTALSQYVEFHRTHHNRRPGNNIDYSFRYYIDEPNGVSLDHWESKQLDGIVKGGYGVKDPNGIVRTVHYEVEEDSGFQAVIQTVLPHSQHYQRLFNGQPKTPYYHTEPVKIL